ncbi:MAG: 23S rRNA (guanosine(2251)-2'-O)-methyltransferase RlmB [Leptonema sp. (in: bacteria)]
MQKIFGKKPTFEFLKIYKSSPEVYKIYKIYLKKNISKNFINMFKELNLLKYIEFKDPVELDSLTQEKNQGIIILYEEIKQPEIVLKNNIKRPKKNLDTKQILKNYPGIYVLTDRIQDPHNLGSIIRASEALGAMGIFITGKGAKINHTVQKVSTSSFLYLPCFQIQNAMNLIQEAKKQNYYILATTTKRSEKSIQLQEIYKIPKQNRYVILMGSENDGLKDILLKNSDYWIEIPLLGKTESLNVNQALSIILYELIQYVYF